MSRDEDALKMAAAQSAVALITEGMIVGLGSGTTAAFAVTGLGRRVQQGLRVIGVPTSERTEEQAKGLGIPISTLDDQPVVELTIDGADEVEEGTLHLIKGHGGALLREKIVASASQRLVIIVDESKVVKRLAAAHPLPVEVVPFGWQTTSQRLRSLGARPSLRRNPDGQPFHSDGGNYILDCGFESPVTAADLAQQLDHIVGVVEHGLFIGIASQVHVATRTGVLIWNRH
jgi:ribose 5-phosphate isomerase A